MSQRWLQIRGDPSVRRFLFEQERVNNELDDHLDTVIHHAVRLVCEHGVFHAKLHFSSGQVTLWLLHDPLRYRVHTKDEFLQPDFCQSYPTVPYTPLAIVPHNQIGLIFAQFKRLRQLDPHIYLRSGSLNVVNGQVGLNFSCDGSHYVDYVTFLARVEEWCSR